MNEYNRQQSQPMEDTIKIGYTTYIITAHFAPQGVTVSEKIKRLLDREIERESN